LLKGDSSLNDKELMQIAINEAINCNKPSIIEIPVDPEELGGDVKL
jgi:hypothetical protein